MYDIAGESGVLGAREPVATHPHPELHVHTPVYIIILYICNNYVILIDNINIITVGTTQRPQYDYS